MMYSGYYKPYRTFSEEKSLLQIFAKIYAFGLSPKCPRLAVTTMLDAAADAKTILTVACCHNNDDSGLLPQQCSIHITKV